MAFATNSDIETYVPDIMEHGVVDWSTELSGAEEDIIRKIRVDWWNKEMSITRFNRTVIPGQIFDTTKLDDTQWTRACVYYALYAFIFPKLTTWKPESDSFREQIDFYRNRFNDEYNMVLAEGIRYDQDGDSTFEENEKWAISPTHIYR